MMLSTEVVDQKSSFRGVVCISNRGASLGVVLHELISLIRLSPKNMYSIHVTLHQ